MSVSTEAMRIRDVVVAFRRTLAVNKASITVPAGQITALLGPNGAGKSTLLKTSVDLLPKVSGHIEIFGQPFSKVRHRVGFMTQTAEVDWDFPATVRSVVAMGRYGKLEWWKRASQADRAIVDAALEQCGISELAGRQICQLSGGQQQRTFLARLLAQETELMLLDEPFAGVDAASQTAISELLTRMRDSGRTVVIVSHDLASIAGLADHVVVMRAGEVYVEGNPEHCLTPHVLHEVYGISLASLPGHGLDAGVDSTSVESAV